MPFKRAKDREINPFHIIEAWGREKSGKTRFSLTSPPPIYLFNFDKGYDRVQQSMLVRSDTIPIEPSFKERYESGLIMVTDYTGLVKERGEVKGGSLQADDIQNGKEILDQFEADWFDMVSKPVGGTAVMDTGTLIWNIAGHVLQKKAPANQPWIQYTMRNDFFRRLLSSARDSGKNVIFLHHDTDIYAAEGGITDQKAQGDKLVARAADVVIRMIAKKATKVGKPEFLCRVEDCGLNTDITGLELTDATWDDLIDAMV